jgi:hypothetical protein
MIVNSTGGPLNMITINLELTESYDHFMFKKLLI